MGLLKTTFLSADITILGHFNPAILRHDFLTQICKFDFGEVVNSSPPEITVASEVQYGTIRWFMDFDRMTIQNFKLQKSSDFTVPQFAEIYLEKLPYTPVFAAGLNLLADFELSDITVLWENLLRPDRIYGIIDKFGGKEIQTISKMGLSPDGGKLLETSVIYKTESEGRVQLVVTRLDTGERLVRCSLNFEVRGIEDRSKFSPFVNQSGTILDTFVELMAAFSERT